MAFVSPTWTGTFTSGAACEGRSCLRRPRAWAVKNPSNRYARTGGVRMTDPLQPVFKVQSQAAHNAWVKAYKSYLARSGEKACQMAMEGYAKLGRGAVFVLDKPGLNVGVATSGGIQQGVMSMYVSLSDIERKSTAGEAEMEPIISRIRLYDASKQFCVVYETGGMQGADIVTPKQMPQPPKPAA